MLEALDNRLRVVEGRAGLAPEPSPGTSMVKAPKAPPLPTPVVETTQQMIRMEVDNIIAKHEDVPYWDHEHVWSELYYQHELGHSEAIGCRCKKWDRR